MNTKTANYYKLQERMSRGKDRQKNQTTSIHGSINASLHSATDYFNEAQLDGTRDLVRSVSNIVSVVENELITQLTPDQSVRVWRAIENGRNGDALELNNAGLTDFEGKLAQLQLAGLALYATPEAQAVGIALASPYDLQAQDDGSVAVAEYPTPEE